MTAPWERPALLRIVAAEIRARRRLEQEAAAAFEWHRVARANQLPPGTPGAESQRYDWRYWLVQAGRGFGKTRTGAEAVRLAVKQGRRRIGFVAPTLGDARQLMIEGDSGILAVCPPEERPRWRADKGELWWPNGAKAFVYSSEQPERIRGPNLDFAWCEEMGSWRHPDMTWHMLRMTMRRKIVSSFALRPQIVITTTPRPTDLIKKLNADPKTEKSTGTTYDNRANLDEDFVEGILRDYEGTRLGEQELEGRLLTDTPGALWTLGQIEKLRLRHPPADLVRVVVAVDPAVADEEERKKAAADSRSSAETGIVVVGRGSCGQCGGEQHAFVLADLSGYYTPLEWAKTVSDAYEEWGADRVVAEVNNGGALVEANIRTVNSRLAYRAVHASRGKHARAEPVSGLYEKGWVHHVGVFGKLEDQMTTWNPLLVKKSPDRMDAAVWGITDLMIGPQAPSFKRPAVHGTRRM